MPAVSAEPVLPASGNGWVQCRCGHKHWGRYGAAGLFLVRRGPDGNFADVVLQHRAPWSHNGDTWAVPGGALDLGETAFAGATRESAEEAGIDPCAVCELAEFVLDHGDWSYTTNVAEYLAPTTPIAITDAESLAIEWVALAEIHVRNLLPAFASSLPSLLGALKNF